MAGRFYGCNCRFCSLNDTHECLCCQRAAEGEMEIIEYFGFEDADFVNEYIRAPKMFCNDCRKNCPNNRCSIDYCCFNSDCECHNPDD